MTIKTVIRNTIEKIFSVLGIEAHLFKRSNMVDFHLFDRNLLEYFYIPDEKFTLYEKALLKTGMETTDNISKQFRHYSLQNLIYTVCHQELEGDIVECGCWKGHSAYLIATHLKKNKNNKTFHIFDSFEGGLSERKAEDQNLRSQMSPEEIKKEKLFFSSGEEEVKKNLSEFNNIQFYKGWIPKRFNEIADKKFSFVHVDVDLYEPTRDSLEFFLPRLVKGGICVIDDYGFTQFPGCKRATDESLKKYPPSFFYPIPSGGAFLIK